MKITLTIVSMDDHVLEAGRNNRTIKDKVCYRMLINIVYGSLFLLNAFLCANGIIQETKSKINSYWERIEYKKHCTT